MYECQRGYVYGCMWLCGCVGLVCVYVCIFMHAVCTTYIVSTNIYMYILVPLCVNACVGRVTGPSWGCKGPMVLYAKILECEGRLHL